MRAALQEDVAIASVGPVMTATLESHGIPVDIVPDHPKMAALVKASAESAAAVLAVKRAQGPTHRVHTGDMVLFFLPAAGTGGFMRALLISLIGLAVTLAPAAVAQQAPPVKTYASSSDVAALIAKAKTDRKENQANFIQQILQLAPYNANLEYRAAVGPAAVHEKEAEMFYVIDGSGTLTTGGKLVGETRTNAENLSGTAIEGGSSRPVAKGDFFIVPENTPHWFGTINGTLVLMSLHVPRTSAAR